jgi:hypothetical protein
VDRKLLAHLAKCGIIPVVMRVFIPGELYNKKEYADEKQYLCDVFVPGVPYPVSYHTGQHEHNNLQFFYHVVFATTHLTTIAYNAKGENIRRLILDIRSIAFPLLGHPVYIVGVCVYRVSCLP